MAIFGAVYCPCLAVVDDLSPLADEEYEAPCLKRTFAKITKGELLEAEGQINAVSCGGTVITTGLRVCPVGDEGWDVRVYYVTGRNLGIISVADFKDGPKVQDYKIRRDGMTPAEVMDIFKGRVIEVLT